MTEIEINNIKYEAGWLDPKGNFYGHAYLQHDEYATENLKHIYNGSYPPIPTSLHRELGWVLVHWLPKTKCSDALISIQRCFPKGYSVWNKLTSAQANWLRLQGFYVDSLDLIDY